MNVSALIGLLIAVVISAIIIGPLGTTLRKHPVPFYLVAIIGTAVYAWALFEGVNMSSIRPLDLMMKRGYLASIFLIVVMFAGCFDEGTPIRKKLSPIRGELSILSFIFIIAHLLTYLPAYLPLFGSFFNMRTNIAVSLVVAVVLTVIFCILGVMSLRIIRNNMNYKVWKGIQRASYLMLVLLVVHVGLVLGKSAFASGFTTATLTFCVYTVVVALYFVLRIRKAIRDHKASQTK